MKKVFFVILLLTAIVIRAQNVVPGGTETIKLKGFISFTTFFQDQSFKFGNGQKAAWANPPQLNNKWFSGFDIRNSRLTMIFNGKKKENQKWTYGGALEFDMFGGYVGSSLFAAQMPMPRVRLAYMDLVHENIRIRLGQAWTPMFGNVPVSMTHIAFPLGYGNAGLVGWRFPGIYVYTGLNDKSSPVKIRMDIGLFAGSWNGPGSNTNFLTGGNFGSPQAEVKFNFVANNWSAYVVGHYDQKDLDSITGNTKDILTGSALEFGAKYHSGGFLLQGNIYSGKNIGQQFGALTQVQSINKDLRSVGAWGQIGYMLSKKVGVYFFYGFEDVNKDDTLALFANPRTHHDLMNFTLKYVLDKQMSLGFDYMNSDLTYGASDSHVKGNQIALSALYKF